MSIMKELYPTLFRDDDDWLTDGLKTSIALVDADELADEYTRLKKNDAPTRPSYFPPRHHGTTKEHPANTPRVQWEQRYAMALWSLKRRQPRPGDGWQCFLDYQVPLKAERSNQDIGEIDLFGIIDQGRFIVVELKSPRDGRGQSPAHALMQGLRYAAIAEANLHTLAREARTRFRCEADAETPPIVQVLGTISWWRDWLDPGVKSPAAGDWNLPFAKLASAFEARTGVTIECLATDTDMATAVDGLRRQRPAIGSPPTFHTVRLERNPPEYEPLS